jgi:cytidine deaminase
MIEGDCADCTDNPREHLWRMSTRVSPEASESLIASAKHAAGHAHAPYSGIRIGAAALTEQGNVYAGCNVENMSFGLTLCAERVAICSAVAGEGKGIRILVIAIFEETDAPFGPCGACRQVMAELCPDVRVIIATDNSFQEVSLSILLPDLFGGSTGNA